MNKTMDDLESKYFDRQKVQDAIQNAFDAICGEYPGAVTVRHSYKRLERLARIDHEEEVIRPPEEPAVITSAATYA